jgi:hypothetical protein
MGRMRGEWRAYCSVSAASASSTASVASGDSSGSPLSALASRFTASASLATFCNAKLPCTSRTNTRGACCTISCSYASSTTHPLPPSPNQNHAVDEVEDEGESRKPTRALAIAVVTVLRVCVVYGECPLVSAVSAVP